MLRVDGGAKRSLRAATVWGETKELVRAHRGRLAVGVGLMLVSRTAAVVLPAASKYLIDDVIGRGRRELLPLLAAAIVGAAIVQAAAAFALSQILGIASHRAIADMRRRVERHVLRLPTSWFAATTTGAALSRIMQDAEGLRNVLGIGMVQFAGGVVTALFAICVLLYLHWPLTLIIVTTLAAAGVAFALSFQKVQPLYAERARVGARISGRLGETLGAIRVVKAYATEPREDLVFARGVHRSLRIVAKAITTVSTGAAVSTITAGVIGVAVLLVGERAIHTGAMTLGELVMFVFFTGLLVAPLMTVASIGGLILEAFAGLARIREVLHEPTELVDDATKAPVDAIRGEVELERVSFEYTPGVPVLADISLIARAGTITALVGPSGAGKSTLIDLMLAFVRPTRGRVLIDGRDLTTLRLREYRAHLGIVLQDNVLFDGTIAENLLYARPDASREEMLEAARIAYVDEFVEPLDDAYETIVGERGVKLSGGQRQRIAIARAIIARPPILFLDEATSSLDSESEAKIQIALRALVGGRTTFVIAHRLSTIRNADQILVLERGRIVERGTHEELLAKRGRYRQLHDQQTRVEGDRFINPGEDFLPLPEEIETPAESDTV